MAKFGHEKANKDYVMTEMQENIAEKQKRFSFYFEVLANIFGQVSKKTSTFFCLSLKQFGWICHRMFHPTNIEQAFCTQLVSF